MKPTARCLAAWKEENSLYYIAKVEVTLKKVVLDPQGVAVENALKVLGYNNASKVRVGKYIELTVEAEDSKTAAIQVEEMSRRLLSNPVIEDFCYTVQEAGG